MNTFFILILLSSISISSIHAHTFSSNESTSFLSRVDLIKSALVPIKEDVSSNITLAKEQAQYAKSLITENVTKELKERNQRITTELISMLDSLQNISSKNLNADLSNLDDILAEAVTVRIERDQLRNTTIQALAFANDINKILDDYTVAVKGRNDNLNASMDMSKMSPMNMNKNSPMNKTGASNIENIKNLSAYQRANALTDIATNRFNTELKGKSNVTSAMEEVAKGLEQLKLSIKDRASVVTVMGIVHGQIHPNLRIAFNLQLAQSTRHGIGNMSMSM